jgi:Xaa-Pro aminopeptidase
MNLDQTITHNEVDIKIDRIHRLLEARGLDALLLRRVSSFAWATCGADSHINTASSEGIASLLITPHHRYLITTNIEAPRLEKEEGLVEGGWELRAYPWYTHEDHLSELSNGMKLGVDGAFPGGVDLSDDLAWMRSQMTPEETGRLRMLCALCSEAMREALDLVCPGMTEYQLAGLLSGAAESRGVQAVVNLIATDQRIFSYRHPLPTSKPLQKYAMLVLCGRKWGLICSLTRLVHFGPLPDDLHRKSEAVARVDAEMIAATRPGNTLADVFQRSQMAYAAAGFPNEWRKHHQGGVAGYEPREVTVTPHISQPILVGQAFAWNPSITGAKSEDTILVADLTNEILTVMPDWPVIRVQIDDQSIDRPAILERDLP